MLLRIVLAFGALLLGSTSAFAAWHEAKSKHFIVYADMDPEKLRRFSEQLERFDQAVRYVRTMDDPPLTDSNRLTVYVLHNDAALARLAGNDGVFGFYRASISGAAAFVPRVLGMGTNKLIEKEAIFFHEYAHHLQLQHASVALPAWVTEGTAEFFSTARVLDNGDVEIGIAPRHRAGELMRRKAVPLDEIVGEPPKELSWHHFEQTYARGWLLTHYLAFEPGRKGQLVRYIDRIQNGTAPAEAARIAFGDIKALDRELDRYFARKTLPAVLVPAQEINVGPIAVRLLRAGEAALIQTRMRSQRGVSKSQAADVASDARRAAAPYPADPFAQTALAVAELDAGNYAAAEAAADKALAADPKYVRALILKGRSQMELTQRDPKAADWKAIRGWFTRANKLDTENAEPLVFFYDSFTLAGQPIPRNAVDGLLYAVALAPQDDRLRILATTQLLRDNRLGDAREIFAPLAFDPHANREWRDAAARTMKAIVAGDGAAAIASLADAEVKRKAD